MDQTIRSAKAASDWTHDELAAYNIIITPTSPASFFQSDAEPSLDHLDPAILTSIIPIDRSLPVTASSYLRSLDFVATEMADNFIDNFAKATLQLLDFEERCACVVPDCDIPLTVCADIRGSVAQVFLLSLSLTVLLVLIQDKSPFGNPDNAEPYVVAGAIGAFQSNNTRRSDRGEDVLDAMTIPCIIMLGTIPTFYLVPVTKELSDAVMTAQYPPSQTEVLKCAILAENQMDTSVGPRISKASP